MRFMLLAAAAAAAFVTMPAHAALLGHSFGVKVGYATFNPPFPSGTLLTQDVTAGANVEVDNLAIDYSYDLNGFPQAMNGLLDVDIADSTLTLIFSGFSVPSSLEIELLAPDGGMFTSAVLSASAGFTPGSNQPGLLQRTADRIKTSFFFIGTDMGTQSLTYTLGFTPPVIEPDPEVPEPAALALFGLGLASIALGRRRLKA